MFPEWNVDFLFLFLIQRFPLILTAKPRNKRHQHRRFSLNTCRNDETTLTLCSIQGQWTARFQPNDLKMKMKILIYSMMSSIIHAQTHTHTRLWSVWLHFFSIVFVSSLNTVHMNQLLHVNTAWWDNNIRFLIRCKPGEIHCELLAVTVLDSAATRERATVAVSMRKKMA